MAINAPAAIPACALPSWGSRQEPGRQGPADSRPATIQNDILKGSYIARGTTSTAGSRFAAGWSRPTFGVLRKEVPRVEPRSPSQGATQQAGAGWRRAGAGDRGQRLAQTAASTLQPAIRRTAWRR